MADNLVALRDALEPHLNHLMRPEDPEIAGSLFAATAAFPRTLATGCVLP